MFAHFETVLSEVLVACARIHESLVETNKESTTLFKLQSAQFNAFGNQMLEMFTAF